MSNTNVADKTQENNLEHMLTHIKEWQTIEQRHCPNLPTGTRIKNRLSIDDKLACLLDPQSPTMPLSLLAGYRMYTDTTLPFGGIHCVLGKINQRWCMVIANDPRTKAGCYFPITVKKHLRAQQIALDNKIPCIYLVDSGGAYLPLQDQLFPDAQGFGKLFFNQATLSSLGVPQIAVVLGSCTAGGAYIPAMTDETIMLRQHAHLFLAGPPLVKAATGEEVTADALGGSTIHGTHSGVADYIVENEQQALTLVRTLIQSYPFTVPPPCADYHPPSLPKKALLHTVTQDTRIIFSMQNIIQAIVDGHSWTAFKPSYGQTIVCGYATLAGHQVGILANEGVLVTEAILKASHFIQLCNKRMIPIVFLHNISGFMVGQNEEKKGIVKHGAKLIQIMSTTKVAKLSLIIGNSYGAGYYAMCGRAFGPRFLWRWPTAKTGIMGAKQVCSVLKQVNNTHNPNTLEHSINQQEKAVYASARVQDDGIIHPLMTRRYFINALEIIAAEKS
jgi:3-methylcrotonyl-CoA carboxylase beta subunit